MAGVNEAVDGFFYPGVAKELEWYPWDDGALDQFAVCSWCGEQTPPGPRMVMISDDYTEVVAVCGACLPEVLTPAGGRGIPRIQHVTEARIEGPDLI